MSDSDQKVAVIIGAGPAGLTAAYELLEKSDVLPIIFEMDDCVGGISRTINYKGNRIDIGGHRFFSKSDRVMDWWSKMIPMQGVEEGLKETFSISYQNKQRPIDLPKDGPNPEDTDDVMLVRNRLSRIYYDGKFFDYPISLTMDTVKKLGIVRMMNIGFSYVRARLFPIKPEASLEDFFINRFGQELYRTFFKDYTEKVWGVPCSEIEADWGAQRIKGLSVGKAIVSAIKSIFPKSDSIRQKNTETSLIQRFLYPKYGPGHMWQTVAKKVTDRGGELYMEHEVVNIHMDEKRVTAVSVENKKTGDVQTRAADYVFSTMPVRHLIHRMVPEAPAAVRDVAGNLHYRDFITVGLLLKKFASGEDKKEEGTPADTWIYIQEPGIKVGRLQIFNNWSPYLVHDPKTVWVGMEYFANKGDTLWSMPDDALKSLAMTELASMGFADHEDLLDSVVIRMEKTYPSYIGGYTQFDVIRSFVDPIENLFLIGRNGMHRYNNQDHSMLTAMLAVEYIVAGNTDKTAIWNINVEDEYHEEKK